MVLIPWCERPLALLYCRREKMVHEGRMDETRLSEIEAWFGAYCRSFAGDDEEARRNYDLKEQHTGKVRENIRLLAESVGMAGSELAMAEVVGLLHDVGRFEQYRRYRTFLDRESVNHAALGVEVIRRHDLLAGLPDQEAETVIQAVRFHNVFMVPPSIQGEERRYLDLIRDADKLDIWRVFMEYFDLPEEERASAAGLGFADDPSCTPAVLACLERQEMVNLALLKTLNDFKLLQLSWVFDLNCPESFRLAGQQGHLARLAASLPAGAEVERALQTVWDFLAERLR